MSVATVLVFCAQALLIQSVYSQCTSRAAVDASGIRAPFGWGGPYDHLSGPFTWNGLAGPYACGEWPLAYDGLAAPLTGIAGPFAYDGLAGWAGRGLGYEGLYPAIASAMEFTPTTSGGLIVTSVSPISPTGISVISENAYEGIVSVAGEVPFVGTTGMEGVLPTAGAAAVSHACGNGINAMISETTVLTPVTAIAPAPFVPNLVLGSTWAPTSIYNGFGAGYIY